MKVKKLEFRLKGAPICRGIAIGKPFFFALMDDEVPEFTIATRDLEEEIERYSEAISKSKEDVKRLQRKLKRERILEGAAILDAHLQIMQDPLLTENIEERIRESRKNAEFVFQTTINQYHKKFQTITDPLFRDRFKDIQDISRRVMGYLRQSVRVSLADIPPNSIVFSEDLTASDTAEANVSRVSAFVTATGGATSHAAIVAKSKGIPYVTDVKFDQVASIDENCIVIVDGRNGDVIFFPTPECLQNYQQLQKELLGHVRHLSKDREFPAETIDGHLIKLSANIDMIDEIDTFHKNGGCGVGLFRSEYIFISNDTFPSEEEQYQIYQRLIKKMKGFPIVIRTFDFGGDKLVLNKHIPFEGNTFLGSRAIRYLLKERDIFKAQIRAILRASKFGEVSIMFPMISALPELIEAKEILYEAQEELEKRGIEIVESIPIGCMIEVPSAAIIADLLAKECDFLSIGTNDLVQYSLAVDRRNHSPSSVSAATDPSVLRMIKLVVSEASHHGIPVTICGEMAADPRFTSLLIGLGVKELSVSPRYIPIIKRVIRNITIVEASHLAEVALSLTNSQEILKLLTGEYQKTIPEDHFYNCSE
jgi:phosphotransferase system enzyme I (PtsI)